MHESSLLMLFSLIVHYLGFGRTRNHSPQFEEAGTTSAGLLVGRTLDGHSSVAPRGSQHLQTIESGVTFQMHTQNMAGSSQGCAAVCQLHAAVAAGHGRSGHASASCFAQLEPKVRFAKQMIAGQQVKGGLQAGNGGAANMGASKSKKRQLGGQLARHNLGRVW
jgi:hypothetical protein